MADVNLETVTDAARDAFYIAVGAGVITFQKLQVQRVELTKAISAQIDDAKGTADETLAKAKGTADDTIARAKGSLDSVSELFEDRVKVLEDRLSVVEGRLESILAQLEEQLPEQAKDLVKQARELVSRAA